MNILASNIRPTITIKLGINCSGVDVNSEVPERSRKNFEMTFFDDFRKISRFFLRKILNDLFLPVTNKCRNGVPADLTISTGTRVPAKYQMPERRSGPFRLVYTPAHSFIIP